MVLTSKTRLPYVVRSGPCSSKSVTEEKEKGHKWSQSQAIDNIGKKQLTIHEMILQ